MVTETRRALAPSLVYEGIVAGYFWLAYVVDGWWWDSDRWPVVGLIPFAVWVACPFLTLVGLLMLPRSVQKPRGWFQVLVAAALAASVWYQFARIEWH